MKPLFFIIAFLALIGIFSFFACGKIFAAEDNYSNNVRQKIQSLLEQIISLLKQVLQIKTMETSTQSKIKTQSNFQALSQPQPKAGYLTVRAKGTKAFVSINGAASFEYARPISLRDGDTYSVTAGNANSRSTCGGAASNGGSYLCDVSIY